MKKKLEISKEEAIELYDVAPDAIKAIFEQTFGQETFVPKTAETTLSKVVVPYEYDDGTTLTLIEKAANAFVALLELTKFYNEAWEPDWSNRSQYKWQPYFYKDGGRWVAGCGRWDSSACFPSGLCFKTQDLARECMTKFESLWKDYYMIE